MSTPEDQIPSQAEQMLRRIAGAGDLDVGLQPGSSTAEPSVAERVLQGIAMRPAQPLVPSESFAHGAFGGFAEGITTPLTLVGLHREIGTGDVAGFERTPQVRGRLLGEVAGVIAGAYPFFLGAKAAMGASGLASALTESQFIVARGALGFGTFEAAASEHLKDVPGRFLFGAALGGAADLAYFRATDAAKLVAGGALGGGGIGALTTSDFEDVPERFAAGAAVGAALSLGLIRALRGKSATSQLLKYLSPRSSEGPTRFGEQRLLTTSERPPTAIGPGRAALPSTEVGPERLLTGGSRAVERFVESGTPLRNGPFFVTPTGVVFNAGPVGSASKRAVELADNELLPHDVSVENVRSALLRSDTPIVAGSLGAGEAFLYTGEASSGGGRVLLTSPATAVAPNVQRGRVVGVDGPGPETTFDNVLPDALDYGTRTLDNGFEFPITRAEGKPLEYDPTSGTAVIQFTPREADAVVQAVAGHAPVDKAGLASLLQPQTISANEGAVLRETLTRALSTKFNEAEKFAALNEPLLFGQAIDEFQSLQLAASRLDVFQPPIAMVIEDLKAIKLLESASARKRATSSREGRVGLEPVFIDADAFALEQSLTGIGEDSLGDSVTKLAAATKSIDEQLEITVAKLNFALNNGGMSLSSVNPAGTNRVVDEIKRQLPTANVDVHHYSANEDWILVSGPEIIGEKALVKETLTTENRAVLDSFIERGTTEDWQRMVDIIEADIAGELFEPPILGQVSSRELLGRFIADRPAFSSSSTGLKPAIIETDPLATPFQRMRTLTHEYFHNLLAHSAVDIRSTTDVGFRIGDAQTGAFASLFPEQFESMTNPEWTSIFGNTPTTIWEELSEVGKLSAWASVASDQPNRKLSLDIVKIEGVRNLLNNSEYYFSEEELNSRVGDVLFTNRKVAEQLAPKATELYLKMIAERSPKMQLVLGDKRLARIGEILTDVAYKNVVELQTRARQFGIIKTAMTPVERAQFRAEGIYPGMAVHMQGMWSDTMLAVKRTGPDLIVRERFSMIEHTIPWSRVTSQDIIPSKALTDVAIKIIRERMDGVKSVLVPIKIPGTDKVFLNRVDLKGVDIVDSYDALRGELIAENPKLVKDIEWMPDDDLLELASIPDISTHRTDLIEKFPGWADDLAVMSDTELFEFAATVGRLGGVPGIRRPRSDVRAIRHDDGLTLILPKPVGQPQVPGEVFPVGATEPAGGEIGSSIVHVTPRQLLESVTADIGLNARDRVYVIDQVLADITKDFTLGLDEGLFSYPEQVAKLAQTFATRDPKKAVAGLRRMGLNPNPANVEAFFFSSSLKSDARQSGYRIREALDGKFVIETHDGLVAGVFTREGAEDWVARAGRKKFEIAGLGPEALENQLTFELGDASQIGMSGASYDVAPSGPGKAPARGTGNHSGLAGGGGSEPVRFGDTFGSNSLRRPGWTGEQLSDSFNLLMPFITGMETMSLTVENVFGIAANTELFEPLQEAVRLIDRLNNVARPGLGGRSWNQKLKAVEKLSFKIHNKQDRENVTRWMEIMSKEEIASGLMTRPMNPFELALSEQLTRLGIADEMPRLLATQRLMRRLVKSRKSFMKRFKSMDRQKLAPEMQERLETLFNAAKSNRTHTFESLAAELNLNEVQARMIQSLEALEQKRLSPETFSLLAVMRHASAEPLPRGFKTMQDAFAQREGLTETQLAMGKELQGFYDELFKAMGLDPKRYLKGYFPHIRVFQAEGILPNDPIMRNVFPKASRFAADKIRTGELDVYAMEPVSVAVKHLRAFMMREHFDPHLPKALEVLKKLKKVDPRSARIMQEYVHELQGRSHDSFNMLQEAIESSAKAMGIEGLDKDLAKQTINALASLSHQALIPFRAGLIARNYFEMALKIPPRTGGRHFVIGLRFAGTKEGYEAAHKAGAVTENVAPVMSGESVLGVGTGFRLNRRMQMISDIGFRWYQKADDFGRAAAFGAQRSMTGEAIDKYMRGVFGKGAKAIQRMLEEGGVKTFNKIHQKQFEALFRAGKIEEGKDFLGMILARETMFRYGHGNHAAGWGAVYGRLFGQFGTWSVQYKDYLIQGLTRGTRKDKARFVAWHTGGNLGMLAGGAMIGLDLWAWVTFPALMYTGGPYVDISIDLTKLVSGNDREQAAAWRSLKFQFVPTLSDPRAIWLPGSYAAGDLVKTFNGEGTDFFGFRKYEQNDLLDALSLAPQ